MDVAIIGGTGIAQLIENKEERHVKTSFGTADVAIGVLGGKEVAFVSRHGNDHSIPPHKINYRANIMALKSLGVTKILAPQAVGSLQEEKKPGDLVFVDQFIDRTRRVQTFYDGPQVAHVSMSEPLCPSLRTKLQEQAAKQGLSFHEKGTYVCIEGPRFSTKAESRMFREWGGDVIGMTLVPEAILAREAELCYASIATVTDYDTFSDQGVTIEEVLKTMKQNEEKVKSLVAATVASLSPRACVCQTALKEALL